MKKFNYQISFYANDEKEAWDKIDSFSKQTPPYFGASILEPHEVKTSQLEKSLEELMRRTKEDNPDHAEEKQAKKILNGIRMVENAIRIVEHCMKDKSAIDKIAEILGVSNKPKKVVL